MYRDICLVYVFIEIFYSIYLSSDNAVNFHVNTDLRALMEYLLIYRSYLRYS